MKMVQIIVCAGCTFPRASPNLILRFPSFICVIGNTRPLLLLVLSFPSPDPVLKFLGEKIKISISFQHIKYINKCTSYYLLMHFQGPKIRLCEFTNTFLNSRESRAPPPFPGSMPWAYFKYISAHTNFFFVIVTKVIK